MRRSFLLIAFLMFGLLALMSPALAQSNVADWTYMTYYNADNNLEGSLYGDLTEMQQVGSTDKVNFLAEVDRAPGYETGFGDWTDTRRFLLKHEPQPILTTDQKLDEIVAFFYANTGADYHNVIPAAAALRQSDPTNYKKKLTDIGVDPTDTALIDRVLRVNEIGLEFNTQPVQDLGEKDMGDPETLVDYVTWAIQNYPAKHYALTISTHGGGWLGNGPDETNNNDMLKLPELVQALSEIKAKTGVDQLDLIGFDACLMGQLEVYSALAPYTKYVLASEETIPGDGWEYTTPFAQLTQNPTMDAKEFGLDVVNAYMKYYAGPGHRTQVDLGLIDESKIQPVEDALGKFAASADQDTLDKLSSLGAARINAQEFDTTTGDALGNVSSSDIYSSVDLISLMDLVVGQPDIDPALKTAAQAVSDAAQAAIIQSNADDYLPDAHGMSIYFPTNTEIEGYPARALSDTVPYPTANPNMSAWNKFLDTFHTTIDTALKPADLKVEMQGILPDDGSAASIYDPPVTIFNTNGEGISNILFVATLQQPDGTQLMVDNAPLSFQTILEDGRTVNEFPSGESDGNDYAWDVETLQVSDGTSKLPAVLFVNNPSVPEGTISGTYVAQADGTQSPATLVFSTDTAAALTTYGTADGSQPSEIQTHPGDNFFPNIYSYGTDGTLNSTPSKQALVYGNDPFTYTYIPAASGHYSLTMVVQDLAGNSSVASKDIKVDNTGLDPAWRGFKDVERGVNFLIPWSWTDPSQLADQSGQVDQLETNDPNGDIRIFVAMRDTDLAQTTQDMVDLENAQTDAQVDKPTSFSDQPGVANLITYSYTGDEGEARTGAVVVVRVDDNNATYTFDIDAPTTKADDATKILDKLVDSLSFFTPFDAQASTLEAPKP